MSNKEIQLSSELRSAVQTIKMAILQSQARVVKVVNQEQLALYYCVGILNNLKVNSSVPTDDLVYHTLDASSKIDNQEKIIRQL